MTTKKDTAKKAPTKKVSGETDVNKPPVEKAPKFLEGYWEIVILLQVLLAGGAYLICSTVDYIQEKYDLLEATYDTGGSEISTSLGLIMGVVLVGMILAYRLIISLVSESLEEIRDHHTKYGTDCILPIGVFVLVIVNLAIIGLLIFNVTGVI